MKAHTLAYQTIHEISPKARVGLAHQYRGFTPAKRWSPLDKWAAARLDHSFNQVIPNVLQAGKLRFLGVRKSMPQAKGTQDFFGINFYTRDLAWFDLSNPSHLFTRNQVDPQGDLSPTGFIANEPEVFFQGLHWAVKFGLPIYITENGTEDGDDGFRRRYLVQHIHQMWRRRQFQLAHPALTFTGPWWITSNGNGVGPCLSVFGPWTGRLRPGSKRPSADLYQAICRENALTSAMVAQFAPELKPILFPG